MLHQTQWIVHNGHLKDDLSADFFLNNRAFRLGDGFFETVRVFERGVCNWPAHYQRILAACRYLNLKLPAVYSSEFMLTCISDLLCRLSLQKGARLRITFFREGGGTYSPQNNKAGFIMEAAAYTGTKYLVKDTGLTMGIYNAMPLVPGPLRGFKYLGNHHSIQAALWAQENKFDDALLENHCGRLAEATSSNLFIVKSGEIHTPPLSEGCVGGVMRMAVINACLSLGYRIFESALDAEDVYQADEVFLTNAIQGIAWVGGFRDKRYYHRISDRILAGINEAVYAVN